MIREFVQDELSEAGLTADQIDRSFELAMEDVGELDLSRLLAERKDPAFDRST
jgi:hypothetical protein